ncbi:MAG: apolipoprotein N-acyltransferase [Armatimonadetes bacterium]|nr:apolipoprotein N-acyltransferase [Armatimonadota bacterium]
MRENLEHVRWRLDLKVALLLAVFSAFLLFLSFPHPGLRGLIWVALVPLYLALRGQGWLRGALIGLVSGFCYWCSLLYWATFFGVPALVALVLWKCSGPVLLGLTLGPVRFRRAWQAAAYGALAYTAMEWFQMLGPLGATWGMLSHSQARALLWIQCTDLVGPWGLSFLIALVNSVLAEWLMVASRAGRARATRQLRGAFAATAGLAALVLGYGAFRLAHPITSDAPPVTFGAVQVSMSRDTKWNRDFADETLAQLDRLSREAAAAGARIIVWPETSIPYRNFLLNPNLTYAVGTLARSTGSWLIVGSIEFSGEKTTYNTASLVTPTGRIADRYDKQRLVPGGEYLPLGRYLRHHPIFDRVMNFVPGKDGGNFRAGDLNVGVLVCYESMVPYLPRHRVDNGAQVILVSTNDGWFGRSSAAAHHFEMAIMAAVEVRRPVVQAGNTGISGVIDPMGRVHSESRLDERTVVTGSVVPLDYISLYVRIGEACAWLCAALWAVGLLIGVKGNLESLANPLK